jgi:putative membrane protein
MSSAAIVVTLIVAALHVYFFVLESVLWTKPTGRRIFRMSPEQALATQVLASNQGVYNLLLAIGLVWSVWAGNEGARLFLLVYVLAAGLYGAATASRSILFAQALPAALALGLSLAV